MGKPFLIVVCGQIGTGKTTAATLLGRMLNVPVVSVDTLIHRIIEKPSNTEKDAIFTSEERAICYATFGVLAEYLLKAGSPIIIDGVFAHRAQRQAMRDLAVQLKVPLHVLYCTCPEPLIKERTENRHATKAGVGYRGYLQMKEIYEMPEPPYVTIDTSKDIEGQLRAFVKIQLVSQ